MAFNKYIILKPEELNLSYTCSGDIVSDSTKYLYALLDLPDKYISLNQAVTFKGGNQIYTVIPDNNFIVQVPHEVIKAPGFYVSIEFSDGKGFRVITTDVFIEVIESGYADGEAPPEPTPSTFDIMLEEINQCKNSADNKADDLSYKNNMLQLKSQGRLIGSAIQITGGNGGTEGNIIEHNEDSYSHKAIYRRIYAAVDKLKVGRNEEIILTDSGAAPLNSLKLFGATTKSTEVSSVTVPVLSVLGSKNMASMEIIRSEHMISTNYSNGILNAKAEDSPLMYPNVVIGTLSLEQGKDYKISIENGNGIFDISLLDESCNYDNPVADNLYPAPFIQHTANSNMNVNIALWMTEGSEVSNAIIHVAQTISNIGFSYVLRGVPKASEGWYARDSIELVNGTVKYVKRVRDTIDSASGAISNSAYVLQEPIVTDISETLSGQRLIALETSYPQTIISTDSSLPHELEINYKSDIRSILSSLSN